ncbi:MAG: response regulator, partial [Pseudomonadota bacterium]
RARSELQIGQTPAANEENNGSDQIKSHENEQDNGDETAQSNDVDGQIDVLVAEDNEVNQIVFKQILANTNVTFKIVENGRLAVANYKASPPKMILMDISMPEMNGKEAAQAIRQHERQNNLRRTPIIGVTAHALKGDMEACIEAGMDDYLSKPVAPSKLVVKVEQWLKNGIGDQGQREA